MSLPPSQSDNDGAAGFLQWANHRVAEDEDGDEEDVREALPSPIKAAAKKKKLRRRMAPGAVDRGYAVSRDLSYNPHTARRKALAYALRAVATSLPV